MKFAIFDTCRKDKKNFFKKLDFLVSRIKKRFDIFYYLRKDIDIEIIKKTIFEEDQRKFIDLISRKYYVISDFDKKKKEDKKENVYLNNLNKECLGFLLKKIEGDFTNFDDMLIEKFFSFS